MWYRHIDSTTKVTPIYKCCDIYGIFNNYNYPLIQKEENDYSSAYKNVRRSQLYQVTIRPKVFPYTDVIYWILLRVDIEKNIFMNQGGSKTIPFFISSHIYHYLKFPGMSISMSKENIEAWPLDVNECFKKLWVKRKNFKSK